MMESGVNLIGRLGPSIIGSCPYHFTITPPVVQSDNRLAIGSEDFTFLPFGFSLGGEGIDIVMSTGFPRDDIIVGANIAIERTSGSLE